MSSFTRIADLDLRIEVFNKEFLLLKPPTDGTDTSFMGHLAKLIFKNKFGFVEELIHTEGEILIKLNDAFNYADIQMINALVLDDSLSSRILEWPVYFDGPDLDDVCQRKQMSQSEFIERLCAQIYEVAMLGFLPGFVYAKGLDSSLQLPRKDSPAKRVRGGSVAMAEGYIGLYSLPSPGGWHCLGSMPCTVLNIPELPPVLMQLQDRVKIKAIDKSVYDKLLSTSINILEYNGLD